MPEDGQLPDELFIKKVGIYNAGFVAFRRTEAVRDLLRWWQGKVASLCISDPPSQLNLDQIWLDFVPALWDGVRIERGAGYNVAYWNLTSRHVSRGPGGEWLVNGEPLVFYHFSGYDPRQPELLSRHHHRRALADLPALRELMAGYARRLADCGWERYSGLPYGHARLRDGTPIRAAWREAVRLGHPALADVADPFDTGAVPDLAVRFEAAEPTVPRLFGERLQQLEGLYAALDGSPLLGLILRRYKLFQQAKVWPASHPHDGNGGPG